jgi:hypothetical protein
MQKAVESFQAFNHGDSVQLLPACIKDSVSAPMEADGEPGFDEALYLSAIFPVRILKRRLMSSGWLRTRLDADCDFVDN